MFFLWFQQGDPSVEEICDTSQEAKCITNSHVIVIGVNIGIGGKRKPAASCGPAAL
jgi:hypothetical protein